MPSIDSLTTKIKKGRGYGGQHSQEELMHGFVCPRANAYGGRDGVIPPGIAAQRGLVPRGMREVTNAEVAAHASKAAEDGKTEEERYLEYYRKAIEAQELDAADHALAAKAVVGVDTPSTVQVATDEERDAVPALRVYTPSAPDNKHETAGRKERVRMFSERPLEVPDDNTLDGFYDSLHGVPDGTGDIPEERAGRARRSVKAAMVHAGMDPALAGPAKTEVVEVSDAGIRRNVGAGELLERIKATEEECRRLREERTGAHLAVDLENSPLVGELRERIAVMDEELRRCKARHETVRVTLGAQEEKLKLGGKGWECRIMGALHFSRRGEEIVLTVSDTAYSSDLIANMATGDLVIVSSTGRTSCSYNGDCVKIYGESDSTDFIAAFRFAAKGRSTE